MIHQRVISDTIGVAAGDNHLTRIRRSRPANASAAIDKRQQQRSEATRRKIDQRDAPRRRRLELARQLFQPGCTVRTTNNGRQNPTPPAPVAYT
jgi:hypothetical protein